MYIHATEPSDFSVPKSLDFHELENFTFLYNRLVVNIVSNSIEYFTTTVLNLIHSLLTNYGRIRRKYSTNSKLEVNIPQLN